MSKRLAMAEPFREMKGPPLAERGRGLRGFAFPLLKRKQHGCAFVAARSKAALKRHREAALSCGSEATKQAALNSARVRAEPSAF
jgi:hypothetical protein